MLGAADEMTAMGWLGLISTWVVFLKLDRGLLRCLSLEAKVGALEGRLMPSQQLDANR